MRLSAVVTSIALSVCSQVAWADQTAICVNTLDERLVDFRDHSITDRVAQSEWNDFCSEQSNYSQRIKARGNAFGGSFAAAGYSVGASTSRTSTDQMTEDDFKKTCNAGNSEYLRAFSESERTSSGAYLAAYFNDCLRIMVSRDSDSLVGNITPVDDKRFDVQLSYVPGTKIAKAYKIVRTTSDDIDCDTGGEDVFKSGLQVGPDGPAAFRCRLKSSNDRGVTPIRGTFTLDATDGSRRKVVEFEYVPIDLAARLQNELSQKYQQQVSDLQEQFASIKKVPTGLIAAFRSQECPTGWELVPDTYGRVIVGAGSQTPSTSPRTVGEVGGSEVHVLKIDELPPHKHKGVFESSGFSFEHHKKSNSRLPGQSWNWDKYTENTGGGQEFNIMQPFVSMTYCAAQ